MFGDVGRLVGFKMESFDGIRENIALVDAAGACAIVHSDDENGIQRLNQEAPQPMRSRQTDLANRYKALGRPDLPLQYPR